jgi:serine/threonine-protein kinase SRPK3
MPDSDSDVRFHAIDDVEAFDRYARGGYHPVAIGDRLGGQYRILHKLGHGSYSTVWLARDENLQRLVAVKVCTADASPRESEILSLLRNLSEVDSDSDGDSNRGAAGRDIIHTPLGMFRIDGPHGTHMCLVSDVARCSVMEAMRRGSFAPLMLPVARAIAAQLILSVAYLHGKGFVHGGERWYLSAVLIAD